ncbi:MAG TPA: RIP metalloprotease RseP [Acetobacteraceae bacterium]|nr:RIP metalloprotease RseP [Acetobacteraceae bacterium]
MLHTVPDFPRAVVAFLVCLGVLVFIHELGHYLAARWRGVHVETFSIGFGRALTSWVDRRGTVWKLGWIPLGGYVKLHGQERLEDMPPERRAERIPGRSFQEKPLLSRAIVVAAGPAANFFLTFVLFFALFAILGRPVTLPVVTDVLPGSAAAKAGLAAQDRVVAIDGAPITTFEELQAAVAAHPGAPMTVRVRRDGAERAVSVTVGAQEENGHKVGLLGIKGGVVEYRQQSIPGALWGGAAETWRVTEETVRGLAQMVSGHGSAGEIGGPLRIAQLSGQVAALGAASFVSFIAVLSVNLGLINLFPIPVLDGGHLLFYLAEAIRGRPLPPRAQEYGVRAGLALLVGLMVFATWNDLGHLGLFRWVAG